MERKPNLTQQNFLNAQEEQKTREFMREYEALCKKYNRVFVAGFQIVYANPPLNPIDTVNSGRK